MTSDTKHNAHSSETKKSYHTIFLIKADYLAALKDTVEYRTGSMSYLLANLSALLCALDGDYCLAPYYSVSQKSSPYITFSKYFNVGKIYFREILPICCQYISTQAYQFWLIYLNI